LKIKQLSLPKQKFGRLFCCEKPAPTPLEARLCSPTEQKPKTSRKKPETRKTSKKQPFFVTEPAWNCQPSQTSRHKTCVNV